MAVWKVCEENAVQIYRVMLYCYLLNCTPLNAMLEQNAKILSVQGKNNL